MPDRDARASASWGWLAAIGHRWPTWLAIALVALLAGDESPKGLSQALLIMALGYLAAAVLQRRQATWVVAVVAIGALAALRLQDWVDPSVVLLAAALALVLWAAVRGSKTVPRDHLMQDPLNRTVPQADRQLTLRRSSG
ncbi:MAG: hypothetical protein ACRDSL_21965 [Pseudonocardiaceae bacterium]